MNIIEFQNIVKNSFSFISGVPFLNDMGFIGNSVTIKNADKKEDVFVAFDDSDTPPKLQYKEGEFSLIDKSGNLSELKKVHKSYKYSYIDTYNMFESDSDLIISTTTEGETLEIVLPDAEPGRTIIIKHLGAGTTKVIGNIDDKDDISLHMSGISITLLYANQWYLV